MNPSRLYLLVIIGTFIFAVLHFCYIRTVRHSHLRLMRSQPWRVPVSGEQPISDVFRAIFWFVQITDLHISQYQDRSRVTDLKEFCSVTIPRIRPELVLVTGDLTDARTRIHLSSRQNPEEWMTYDRIVRNSGVLNVTKWFDIRGNHDTFNVVRKNSSKDYFNFFGVQGRRTPSAYSFHLRKPFGNYSFLALDITPNYGISFPLNFFTELTPEFQKHINHLVKEAEGSNHTFWFGHYPTSTIVSPDFDIRTFLARSALAYFCGHMHTLLGLVPRMYAVQPQGYLELELGDWRDKRYYRVVAVDHDLLSFTDVQAAGAGGVEWPIVIITNPKSASLLLPHREPAYRIATSTHIRILAWSLSPIKSVTVKIDQILQGKATQRRDDKNTTTPLYTLEWNATSWADGHLHQIQVDVIDQEGNKRTVEQPFVVGGEPFWDHSTIQTFVLHTSHTRNVHILFYVAWSLLLQSIILPWILPRRMFYKITCHTKFGRGLCRFATCKPIFWPLVIYLVYEACGPIFAGYLISGHFGVVFSFGIYIDGHFLPETLTYLYEFIQLTIFFLFSLCYHFSYAGKPSVLKRNNSPDTLNGQSSDTPNSLLTVSEKQPKVTCSILSIPVTVFIHACAFTLFQFIFMVITVGIPYGLWAILIAPGRWGPILVTWNSARRIRSCSMIIN
ncbi:unnamed protein product [Calicophoron daubneyi]|uniref:Calcineurin-like phosphoesterase domain-containing protein n=1 Tax=Calicophoron daubneyi TaxID=300641 RepID=A0AAV2T791_CALDB